MVGPSAPIRADELRKELTSRLAILTSLPFTRWHLEGGASGERGGSWLGSEIMTIGNNMAALP